MRFLPDELADALGRVVADVQRQARKDVELVAAKSDAIIAQMSAKIFELESRIGDCLEREVKRVTDAVAKIKDGEPGPPGPPGEKGEAGLIGEKGDRGEPGKDGEPGPSGAPGRIGDVGPSGTDGKNGRDGVDGINGKDGRDGIDGKEGAPGRDGRDGMPGLNGKDGEPGKDGLHGKDGRDGFNLEDFDVSTEDDGRTIVHTFKRGDLVIRREIKTAIVLDRGVYRPELKYEKGDSVSFGGSLFIAQQDTDTRPETGPEWRLAVKRGRDGKDGKPGEKGEKGDKGAKGDLTYGR